MVPVHGDSGGWWNISLRARGVALLAFPLAALFAALFATYWVEGNLQDADRAVARAYDVRSDLLRLRSTLLDAETAIREEGTAAQLEPVRKSVGEAQAILSLDVAGDPTAVAEMDGIRTLIASTMGELGPSPGSGGSMRDLQAHIDLLSRHEEERVAEALQQRELARRRLFRMILMCAIVGPIAALFAYVMMSGRTFRRLRAAGENVRRLAHGLPLEPSPAGKDEIAALGFQIEEAARRQQERDGDLRASTRRYEELFENAPIPYEETDREGVIRRFNPAVCKLLRLMPGELAGRRAWDFLAPEGQDAFRTAMLDRIARGIETGPFECEYLLQDGACLVVEIRENLIRNNAGEVTGTVRSLIDITERNLARIAARKVELYALELRNRNEQLARALEGARSATVAKSRFLASVSHELRTPLNGIIGFSELLYDGKLGPLSSEQCDVLNDILTSARHLLHLISDILDLSKVEAGRMEFHPEHHQLRNLVLEVRDVVRPIAQKKKLTVTIETPDGLAAHIDGARFKQVLYNYLSNAVKFTPEGGTIAVRVVAEDGDRFRLDVEDTGIGIAEDELPRLFQEFSQLPNSRKAEQGTGLGLALTRYIVEAQHGSVAVRSEPGKGSVFSAVLPLQNAARTAYTES